MTEQLTPAQNAKLHRALTGQDYRRMKGPSYWLFDAETGEWKGEVPDYSTDLEAFKNVLRPAMREQGWRYGLRENLLVGIVKVAWVGHEKGCGAEAPFADEQATAARLAFETLGLERE